MDDLRSYLGELEKHDLLSKIGREVDSRFELPAVLKKIELAGKAALFEKVKGSAHPVVSNLLGSRRLLALALGCELSETGFRFLQRSRELLAPIMVSGGPVHEVVALGAQADVGELPVVVHCEKDAGRYVTAGLVVAKDPETGIRNVSINRMMVKSGKRLGIRMMPPQQLGVIHSKAEEKRRDLEVAIAIGVHPALSMAAATTLPFGTDEFSLAGALLGRPVELVRCKTVDVEVPANAEIVMEGRVLAGVREKEGPYGDMMQYYIPEMENHVLELSAITRRKDAIYQTIQASSLEDMHLLAISREAKVLGAVMATGAEVKAVSLVPMIFGAVISIRKRFEGEPKNVAAAAFGSYSWLKYCVLVDHDVDVFDINDVWWAMMTRSAPARGSVLISNALGFPRDPFDLHSSKLAIDATAPLNQWQEFERKRVPGVEQVDLKEYLRG